MRFFIICFTLLVGFHFNMLAQDTPRTNSEGKLIPKSNTGSNSNTSTSPKAPTKAKAPTKTKTPTQTKPKTPSTTQTQQDKPERDGKAPKSSGRMGFVNVIVNSDIETLVSKRRFVNEKSPYIDGWRIQILQSTDKTRVMQQKVAFTTEYPELPIYFDYVQPYFKLRAGNYANRYEAYSKFKQIREDFDRAFLVRDRIRLDEL